MRCRGCNETRHCFFALSHYKIVRNDLFKMYGLIQRVWRVLKKTQGIWRLMKKKWWNFGRWHDTCKTFSLLLSFLYIITERIKGNHCNVSIRTFSAQSIVKVTFVDLLMFFSYKYFMIDPNLNASGKKNKYIKPHPHPPKRQIKAVMGSDLPWWRCPFFCTWTLCSRHDWGPGRHVNLG